MTEPDPRPDDLAAVRAEGRRLLAAATEGPWHQMAAAAWSGTNEGPNLVADCPLYADAIAIVWLRNNADALLADPAPEGLSEEERWVTEAVIALRAASAITERGGNLNLGNHDRLIREAEAIFPRLSTPTEEGTYPEEVWCCEDCGNPWPLPGDPPIFAECDHCGGPLNAARPEENPDD